MQIPTLVDMLKSGVHFGHKKSKWHPHMAPYIFLTKKDTHIVDLEQTRTMLEEAANAAKQMAAEGKKILFVGTKRQAAAIVEKRAKECGMPYVSTRWLGGYLTNFSNVSGVPHTLTKLKRQREAGELGKYTKKEQLEFDREIERLEPLVGGLEHIEKIPDALFIIDVRDEKTALREANQMKVPVIAMCDTNADPFDVAYAIPANDDAVKSIELIVGTIAEAIAEGVKEKAEAAPVEEAVPAKK
ncbi:MAG: 30S ribosomal protein S2 [Candidatus Kerfeldbacteria bacterium]